MTLHTDTAVTDIAVLDNQVHAITLESDETIETDTIVSVAGPWNPTVAEMVGLSLPVKHTLAPVLELSVNGLADYSMPIVNHYDSPFSFHRRTPDAFLVGYHPGGYETASRYDAESVPEHIPASIRRDARSALPRFFPQLGDSAVVDEWTGIRSVTPDGNPIIGPTSVEGFSIAAFHTSGIQLAPATGKLLAAQILGESEPSYADQVSLTRFTNHDSTNGVDAA